MKPKGAKTGKRLVNPIYHSGSINHSGTAKKLDSQAQIACHITCPYDILLLSWSLIVTNDISPTIFHFGTEAMTALWTIDGAREAFLRGQQLAALFV